MLFMFLMYLSVKSLRLFPQMFLLMSAAQKMSCGLRWNVPVFVFSCCFVLVRELLLCAQRRCWPSWVQKIPKKLCCTASGPWSSSREATPSSHSCCTTTAWVRLRSSSGGSAAPRWPALPWRDTSWCRCGLDKVRAVVSNLFFLQRPLHVYQTS